MKDSIRDTEESPSLFSIIPLSEIIREGAQKVVRLALESEFKELMSQYNDLKEADGKQSVVRNGYHPERSVMTSAGNIRVKMPRLNDRREGISREERLHFRSKLLPPYLRRSTEVDEFIPYLYLKGISTGDFSDVLSQLLGEEVSVSAQTVCRLKKKWEEEYCTWRAGALSAKRYVYWWVDGVYFNIRTESERSCMLVIIGALSDGTKEFVAVEEGPRESELSWQNLLLNLKRRGLTDGPLLAIGDGALGFWNALKKEYPQSDQQRCWVHKTANVLDKLPKSVQSQAKGMIHEIYKSPSKKASLRALDDFAKVFEGKYPKATKCLVKDKQQMLAFYDFPAEHWRHIRSTNVIESTFSTVRLRTYKTRGCLSKQTALTMVFKLIQAAQKNWQRIHGYKLLPVVLAGESFIDGVLQVQAA